MKLGFNWYIVNDYFFLHLHSSYQNLAFVLPILFRSLLMRHFCADVTCGLKILDYFRVARRLIYYMHHTGGR